MNIKGSTILHGLSYTLLIINLFLMNMNVLLQKPAYIFFNIPLSLIAILLCVIVLFRRKGIDNTPLFGIFINLYSIIIVIGTLHFYNP